MKCPHCLVDLHDQWTNHDVGHDAEYFWRARWTTCPNCGRFTIYLSAASKRNTGQIARVTMAHPRGISRTPLSPDVPNTFAEDYQEACLVFADSAKASAALSRRCLQRLIREHVGIRKATLAQEIDAVLGSKSLPVHLSDAIDGVRNIGNFAAHPEKNTNTGEVVEVEDGEAEWLLDTIEGLFDFYFVAPAALQRKKDALNKKLAEAGKNPMK